MVADADLKSAGDFSPCGFDSHPRHIFMSKLGVNKKFFSLWNSEMAYILGFIVADGCIGVKRVKKDGSKRFYMNITSKDIAILEKIKRAMRAEQKINSKFGSFKNSGQAWQIQIGHQEICKDLLALGVTPRKSYKLDPIRVPDECFADYVRGFFDGDGTVYIYEVNKTPQIKAEFISTSLSFLKELNQRLCRNLRIPSKSIHRESIKGKMTMHGICFYIDDCEKLADFMYRANPTLCLERKRQIFKSWKSIKRRDYIKQNYPSKIGWYLNQKVFT